MIRINLMDPDSRRRASRPNDGGAKLTGTGPTTWGGLMLLAAVIVVGGHYLYLLHQGPAIAHQLAAARAENSRMQDVEKQVDTLQAHRKDLDQRIQAIEQLGDKTTGPSPLLTTLGNSVNGGPDLWLTQLDETGADLKVDGVASNLDRIADFMTSLEQSGEFANVKLDESTEKPGAALHTPYTFRLALRLAPGTVVVATAAPAASPTAAH